MDAGVRDFRSRGRIALAIVTVVPTVAVAPESAGATRSGRGASWGFRSSGAGGAVETVGTHHGRRAEGPAMGILPDWMIERARL